MFVRIVEDIEMTKNVVAIATRMDTALIVERGIAPFAIIIHVLTTEVDIVLNHIVLREYIVLSVDTTVLVTTDMLR